MRNYEVSREKLMAELKDALDKGKALGTKRYRVSLTPPMGKEEFARLRKRLEMTQVVMAETLELSVKTIQAYEQGRLEVPLWAAKLLRLLSTSPSFLAYYRGVEHFDEDLSDNLQVENIWDVSPHETEGILCEVRSRIMDTMKFVEKKQVELLTSSPEMTLEETSKRR